MPKTIALVLSSIMLLTAPALAEKKAENPASLFLHPPDSAKPWVYWWWLNGNVTREGITKDLEEMKRQGINGVLIFNAGGGEGPAGPKFLSPEWHDLFKHALRVADKLKMEVSVNLCDGWDAGGPWITADCANKKLVYSEMQVEGPGKIERSLPMPPMLDNYYHDAVVIAFPEKTARPIPPANVTASSTLGGYCDEWNFPPDDAVDNDPDTFWTSGKGAPSSENPAWLTLEFAEPLSACGAYIAAGPDGIPGECELQVGVDASHFSSIAQFAMTREKASLIEFPEAHGSRFRLVIKSSATAPVQLSEFSILRKGDVASPRRGIKWWPFKSGNRSFWDYPRQGPAVLREEYPGGEGEYDCHPSDVVDLTAKVDERGQLTWDVPPGRWTVLRFGYTVVGQRTRCGTTVVGYESDMLNAKGIETHFKATAEPLLADASEVNAQCFKYLHIDSYEVGADVRGQQPTWVEDFREEFKTRRGYDLLPYLPAMARRIVDSRSVTNRFLWDFRRTIGDLIAERFFGRFAELGHEHGMLVHSETGYGTYPWPHIDGLQCAGKNDIAMGEFWHGTDIMSQFNQWGNVIKTVSSAAHTYGRNIVQAEAFTSWNHWLEYPASLKPTGDEAFCNGLNRMVFHQYTHQPRLDIKPGWQYGAGTHFDRNITWWEQSRAFFEYLARCQYLLQQGKSFADICWFYGEGVTTYVPSKEFVNPAIANGYDFDAINADVLLRGLDVKDAQLVLPDGVSYGVLALAQDLTLSPGILKRLKELIEAGATIVGAPPAHAPGLTDFPACDQEVNSLADRIWGDCDGENVTSRPLGKGFIFRGVTLDEVLKARGLFPDFETALEPPAGGLRFIHRTTPDAEIYFVANSTGEWFRGDCMFRVSGRAPELWDPVSGETRMAQATRQPDGRTAVHLEFAPYASVFVVFRASATGDPGKDDAPAYAKSQQVQQIDGPWNVEFDPKWGGPEEAVFETLTDWTQRPETGIKYYSGKAIYRKQFDIDESLLASGQRLFIDLGKVMNVAEVRLNGKDLGVVWTAPWRVEITPSIKAKGNRLEIAVVNLWPNRVIGDAALPESQRLTTTNVRFPKEMALLESGLLGPVTLQRE